MLFSTAVTHYRCASCRRGVTRATSTAFLYYLGLLVVGLTVTLPSYGRAFELAGWERMFPIAIGVATLIGSALVWSAASRLFRENVKICSRCGGRVEIVGSGFNHGLTPNLEDVVIGLLFAGMQVAVVLVVQAASGKAV